MKKNLREDYDIIYYCAGINNNYIQLKPYNIVSIYQQINNKLSLDKRIVVHFEKSYNMEKNNSCSSNIFGFFKGFFYGFGYQIGKSTAVILEIAGGIYSFLIIKRFLKSDKGKALIDKAKSLGDNAKNIYNSINDNNKIHIPGCCNCQECRIKNSYEGYQYIKEHITNFGNYLLSFKSKK